jgi:hypothetical protein
MFRLDNARINCVRRGLERLSLDHRRWVSFAFLNTDEVQSLREHAKALPMRKARRIASYKNHGVFQDFDICFPAPRAGAIASLAACLEQGINRAVGSMSPTPLSTPVRFDDFAVQRYDAGSDGIGVHRDAARYREIVAIVTLAGASRLFATAARCNARRVQINDRPGRIVLLSAPGFAGREDDKARPFHGVDNVVGGRLSLGLRISLNEAD